MSLVYDAVVVTKTEARYEVDVRGAGPWAIALDLILAATYDLPLHFYRSDGLTFCQIASEVFEVTGVDREAAALVLERAS